VLSKVKGTGAYVPIENVNVIPLIFRKVINIVIDGKKTKLLHMVRCFLS